MVLKRIPITDGAHEDEGGLNLNALRLVLGLKKQKQSDSPFIRLYPVASEYDHGVIVKIQPHKKPANRKLHVPCDLVLSIDVSGSMQIAAPMPSQPGDSEDAAPMEDAGLSVLDLVKHAARTIMETLDSEDRLGIVTFSSNAKVLQPLTPMTSANKATTLKKIEGMRPQDMTNLWHGIRDGLNLFSDEDGKPRPTGRVPALLVLTDGLPNHMNPSQGFIPKLRSMEPLPATIHTFGFGYNLQSGLLKSIAEIGGGNYSFIPDAGMIGTVFVHATANLQSTFANNAKLCLTYPSYLQLEETTGESVDKQEPVQVGEDGNEPLSSLTILLSNLQYGQSRDIYLRYGKSSLANADSKSPPAITAELTYQHFTPSTFCATATRSALDFTSGPSLPPAEIAYHISRSLLVAFLSTLSPLNSTGEHEHLKQLPSNLPTRLQSLLASLPASNPQFSPAHPGCASLLTDLCGTPCPNRDDPASWTGQIALALLNDEYYRRWGAHYLPSLSGAHARQVCNSFKDAGPLRYGADSPLFRQCRDRLDAAFDKLPAPSPSLADTYSRPGEPGHVPRVVNMGWYNRADNGCFAGCVRVVLAKGEGTVRVGRLRAGMEVATPKGARRVVGVLRMPVERAEMCVVGRGGRLLVTPWHPVALREGGGWVFPKDVAVRKVRYTGSVYSVLLERDEDADAHAILVGGVWGVTMGHGLTEASKRRDVRVHQFYGDYDKVNRAMARLPRRAHGMVLGAALTRDSVTGMVNGFGAGQATGSSGDHRKAVCA